MRHYVRILSTGLLALSVACSDRATTTSPDATARRNTTGVIPLSGTCTPVSSETIIAGIRSVFAVGSPNANASIGKFNNIIKQKNDGRTAEVENKSLDLVGFWLEKNSQNPALDGDAIVTLSNQLLCFSGLDVTLGTEDATLLRPSDEERVFVTADQQAAIITPPGVVSTETLVSITDTDAILNTLLDKYPTVKDFSRFPDGAFNFDVVSAVCTRAPVEALPHLVLGHNITETQFQLLPRPAPDKLAQAQALLNCASVAVSDAGKPSLFARVKALLTPGNLFAQLIDDEPADIAFGAGGVGGSAREWSPIGPVDPRIRVAASVPPATFPIGSVVASDAPSLTFTTPFGPGPSYRTPTKLPNIEVMYVATAGTGASVAPSLATSNADGIAPATWRTGDTPREVNSILATPLTTAISANGPAVNGVVFSQTSTSFSLTTTAPSQLAFTSSPTASIAGTTLSAIVEARDAEGRVVEGYAGIVDITSTPSELKGTTTAGAMAGVATFSGFSIEKAGSYTLTATGGYAGAALTPATSAAFTIGAASAANLAITAGNNLSRTAGTTLGANGQPAPTVLVTDAYGNPVSGQTVYFSAANNAATVTPATQQTSATGHASTTWTLLPDLNRMLANLDEASPEIVSGPRFKYFEANGTTTTIPYITCLPGNNRNSITDNAVRFTTNNEISRINGVTFWFSITGNAKEVSRHDVAVQARVRNRDGTMAAVVYESKTTPLYLRGSASEQYEASFTFDTPVVPVSNGSTIVLNIVQKSASQGTILYNAGNCPAGGKCSDRKDICTAKQVPNANPFAAAPVRESVAIRVRGS